MFRHVEVRIFKVISTSPPVSNDYLEVLPIHSPKLAMYHLLAVLTILIWGITFVSTKILLTEGLTPSSIFVLRFTLAYLGLTFLQLYRQQKKKVVQPHTPSPWYCQNLKDELTMLVAGLAGGSLYFLTENNALKYTLAGNVSLIVCLSPLITALLALIFHRNERAGISLWTGSLVAFIGVAFLVYGSSQEGSSSHPLLGNILALLGACCWSVYQLIVNPLTRRYGTLMTTRKVFGYGLLTIMPVFIYEHAITVDIILKPLVWGNLLFLGVVASLICYLSWNKVVEQLGSIVSANYIYLDPLSTCLFSYLLLHEKMTGSIIIGGAAILFGLYIVATRPKILLKFTHDKRQ